MGEAIVARARVVKPGRTLTLSVHPATRIDELLPHNWEPPRPEPPT